MRNWILRYYQFLVVLVDQFAQLNDTTNQNATAAILNGVSPNLGNMTITEILANNSAFIGNFSQWFSTVKSQIFNSQPGLQSIPPGYRAIVRWVRAHII